MKKHLIKTMSTLLILVMSFLLFSFPVSASEGKINYEIPENANVITNSEEILIYEIENTRIVIDKTINESVSMIFDDSNHTSGEIIFPDGDTSKIEIKDDTIFLDDEMIVKTVETVETPFNGPATRASNWMYMTTNYYDFNVHARQSELRSIAWSVLTFAPKPIGDLGKVMNILEQLYRYNAPKGYMKIVSYRTTDYHEFRNDCFVYKSSNYTGLISSYSTYDYYYW